MSKLLLAVGAVVLVVGLYLTVTSHLFGTMQNGLNGATENAVIFDLIGIVCLIAGWASRR